MRISVPSVHRHVHIPCAPLQHILTRRLERGRPAAAARGARVWCGERVAAAGVGDVRASVHTRKPNRGRNLRACVRHCDSTVRALGVPLVLNLWMRVHGRRVWDSRPRPPGTVATFHAEYSF